jgi:hypothetical protein
MRAPKEYLYLLFLLPLQGDGGNSFSGLPPSLSGEVESFVSQADAKLTRDSLLFGASKSDKQRFTHPSSFVPNDAARATGLRPDFGVPRLVGE